jgi:hypothetical protein
VWYDWWLRNQSQRTDSFSHTVGDSHVICHCMNHATAWVIYLCSNELLACICHCVAYNFTIAFYTAWHYICIVLLFSVYIVQYLTFKHGALCSEKLSITFFYYSMILLNSVEWLQCTGSTQCSRNCLYPCLQMTHCHFTDSFLFISVVFAHCTSIKTMALCLPYNKQYNKKLSVRQIIVILSSSVQLLCKNMLRLCSIILRSIIHQ